MDLPLVVMGFVVAATGMYLGTQRMSDHAYWAGYWQARLETLAVMRQVGAAESAADATALITAEADQAIRRQADYIARPFWQPSSPLTERKARP